MSLSKFRVVGVAPNKSIDPLPEFRPMRVLSFDQSLANTGWVFIEVENGNPVVRKTGHFKTERELKGHADSLNRGIMVYREVLTWMRLLNPDMVVHELPPVGPSRRPESSMVAAFATRCAAYESSLPVEMISAQKIKARFTGNPKAEKKEIKDAMLSLVPSLLGYKPLNEHVCDALALGLVAMEEANGRS